MKMQYNNQHVLALEHHVDFGINIYIATSLENWSLSQAIKMKWTENDVWVCLIKMPSNKSCFEYKYVSADYNDSGLNSQWERGQNRVFKRTVTKADKGNIFKKMKINKVDRWEQRSMSFFLQSPPILSRLQNIQVYLTGNCKQIDVPKLMKPMKYKDRTILRKKIYLDFNEIEKVILYNYYIIVIEKACDSKFKGIQILNQDLQSYRVSKKELISRPPIGFSLGTWIYRFAK